jgi:hypothetical protein
MRTVAGKPGAVHDASRLVLVLWTARSAASELVENEAALALEKSK